MGNWIEQIEDTTLQDRIYQAIEEQKQTCKEELIQIIARLVHDFRNPLSSVKMGISTLGRRIEQTEANQHVLRVTLREVSHLEQLMKDVHAYVKPPELNLRACAFQSVLQLALDQAKPRLKAAGVELIEQIQSSLPEVSLDSERFLQLMDYLMINAGEAIASEGTVTVQCFHRPDMQHVRLQILDTGTGISSNVLPRIFDEFYTTRSGHLGLGLTLTKSWIEAFGGTISIESSPGKGTIVEIVLPVV